MGISGVVAIVTLAIGIAAAVLALVPFREHRMGAMQRALISIVVVVAVLSSILAFSRSANASSAPSAIQKSGLSSPAVSATNHSTPTPPPRGTHAVAAPQPTVTNRAATPTPQPQGTHAANAPQPVMGVPAAAPTPTPRGTHAATVPQPVVTNGAAATPTPSGIEMPSNSATSHSSASSVTDVSLTAESPLQSASASAMLMPATIPGGLWVSPGNNATVGDYLTIEAQAYPTYVGDPAIWYVNFTGWYNGKWNVICSVSSPSYSDVYECAWRLAGVVSPGWVSISFDVYNTSGEVNYAPNGTHSIDYVPPPPGGLWVAPGNNATVGDNVTIEAQAYPTNSGDPAISHVNFTGWYNGAWNVICSVSSPTYSDVYECPWLLSGVISPGYVTISFDVYDVIGHVNYAPNGTHSIDYVPSPPGGLWVAPANGAQVGDTTTIEAQAYPTNSGDPAIWYVNFTGWYNGAWNVICSVSSPSYSDVYECAWTLRGVISPGYVTISFDVYDVIGHVNYAPNGTHSIDYVPPPPGGLWVAPANNATVGDVTMIEAQAYPTYVGDPAIAHVNFTGYYGGAWHVICSVYTPTYSDVYECSWHPAGVVSPGWVTISFDVYDVIGHVHYGPNGAHSVDYVPPPPTGAWVAPTYGATVGDGTVLQAQAHPANAGDPAIAHVNFTGYYNGAWHIICSVSSATYSNVYECPWMLKGVIIPGYVTVSFDVYDVAGHVRYGPSGTLKLDYVPGAAKPTTAIAWAMTKIGNTQWNGLCEVFVENAYGTQNTGLLTAQDAYVKLHTSTSWTPDIGALVWFAPNLGNQNAGHVGIYIGNGQFISATETSHGVWINSMTAWSASVATYEGWGDAPSAWPGL